LSEIIAVYSNNHMKLITYTLLAECRAFNVRSVIYTRCPGGNVPDFGRMFLKLKYTDNPKHLYPKLNVYGHNGERKVWSSRGSTYCTCFA